MSTTDSDILAASQMHQDLTEAQRLQIEIWELEARNAAVRAKIAEQRKKMQELEAQRDSTAAMKK